EKSARRATGAPRSLLDRRRRLWRPRVLTPTAKAGEIVRPPRMGYCLRVILENNFAGSPVGVGSQRALPFQAHAAQANHKYRQPILIGSGCYGVFGIRRLRSPCPVYATHVRATSSHVRPDRFKVFP